MNPENDSDGPSGRILPRFAIISFHQSRGEDGGAIASRHIRRMIELCSGGTCDALYQDVTPGTFPLAGLEVGVRSRSAADKLLRLLLTGGIGRHAYTFRDTSGPGAAEARVLVVDGKIDSALIGLLRPFFGRIVAIHHNYEPDCSRDMDRGSLLKPWYMRSAVSTQRRILQQADLNLFLTEEDIVSCRRAYARIPFNAALLGYYETAPSPPEPVFRENGRFRALISGTLSTPKGYIGLVEFLGEFERRRAEFGLGFELVVAGRNPHPDIRRYADSGLITLVPNPPSLTEIARGCDLYCNPNFTGSGIKVRNFDGLRNAVPVICRRENAAGFAGLPTDVFGVFRSSPDGVEMMLSRSRDGAASAGVRNWVWSCYNVRYGLEAGIRRFAECLAPLGVECVGGRSP